MIYLKPFSAHKCDQQLRRSAFSCARAGQFKHHTSCFTQLRYLEYKEQLKGHIVWEKSI